MSHKKAIGIWCFKKNVYLQNEDGLVFELLFSPHLATVFWVIMLWQYNPSECHEMWRGIDRPKKDDNERIL